MATIYDTQQDLTKLSEGDKIDLGAAGSYVYSPSGTFEPVAISTSDGVDIIQQNNATLDKLSGTQPATEPPTPNGMSPDAFKAAGGTLVNGTWYYPGQSPDKGFSSIGADITKTSPMVTFINPETDQKQTISAEGITPDIYDSLTSQGYSIAESSGAVPGWILSGNSALGRAEKEAADAKTQLNELTTALKNSMVSDFQFGQQIDAISRQWNARITDMQNINARREATLNTTGIRLGSRYTGGMFGGIVSEEERQGVARIAELEAQKQAAIQGARDAASEKNWRVYDKLTTIAQDAYSKKLDEVKKLNEATVAQNQKINEQKIQASRDSAIADLYSQGVTDPATILNYLNYDDKGKLIGDFTLKQVSDTLKDLAPDINRLTSISYSLLADLKGFAQSGDTAGADKMIADTAAQYGLDPIILKGKIAELRQKEVQWGQPYTDKTTGDVLQTNMQTGEVRKISTGTSGGGNDIAATEIDPTSKSILAQTGLSFSAFMALTGQMSSLSRDAATRKQALKEAQEWANKKGVDISTIGSQYQTYNKVLAFNTMRQNMAVIQEQELDATIDNLQAVAEGADLSKLNWGNVVKIWAGQEVNDPLAQQYAFHLGQLRSEMVAYNLIAQGQVNSDGSLKQSDQSDLKAAETIIKNGVSSGSLDGLRTAVANSTGKMTPILQRSVDSARKSIWNLFGVAGNFENTGAGGGAQGDPMGIL